jgi:hypothetical protein
MDPKMCSIRERKFDPSNKTHYNDDWMPLPKLRVKRDRAAVTSIHTPVQLTLWGLLCGTAGALGALVMSHLDDPSRIAMIRSCKAAKMISLLAASYPLHHKMRSTSYLSLAPGPYYPVVGQMKLTEVTIRQRDVKEIFTLQDEDARADIYMRTHKRLRHLIHWTEDEVDYCTPMSRHRKMTMQRDLEGEERVRCKQLQGISGTYHLSFARLLVGSKETLQKLNFQSGVRFPLEELDTIKQWAPRLKSLEVWDEAILLRLSKLHRSQLPQIESIVIGLSGKKCGPPALALINQLSGLKTATVIGMSKLFPDPKAAILIKLDELQTASGADDLSFIAS